MMKSMFLTALGCAMPFALLHAQDADTLRRVELGLEYNTELQTDFKRAKWVNLLRLDGSVAIAKGFSLSAATLSTAQTHEQPLIDDLQGFSNIEAENIPLTLAVLSLDWETEHTTLSVGVRNFNENYFATPLTSFFTQSSHGIFPTLSANFPIANYPVASVGVDFQWRIKQFALNASLYNGVGYKNFLGRENLFRFCPKSDGLFGALQLSHEADYGNAHVGAALHHQSERTRTALWAYTELNLTATTQLLAQYSFAVRDGFVRADAVRDGFVRADAVAEGACQQHASLGLKQTLGRVELGVAENFARFDEGDEWATELSARVPLTRRQGRPCTEAFLQPVVHLCHTAGSTHCVGLLRMTLSL